MRRTAIILFAAMVLHVSQADGAEPLRWEELPQLPPSPGESTQVGIAGPFAGVHNGGLLVAGGANFPDAPPWNGGKKTWWADVFVLPRLGGRQQDWVTNKRFKLPRPLAYGAAVSLPKGVLCIGGCDADRCYRDVFFIQWDPKAAAISCKAWPALPRPLAFMAAAKVADTVYVAGGQDTMKDAKAGTHFFALDLSQEGNQQTFQWRRLPAWPGPPRILPIVAAQSDGKSDCLYLFSGRNAAPGAPTELLTDAWCYSPGNNQWTRRADVAVDGKKRCVMAGTGIGWGANQILIFGGADGKLLLELAELGRRIAAGGETAALVKRQTNILESHPGFSRDVLAYHTINDTWTKVGRQPSGSHVTTMAVRCDDSIVIPSGEIRPGVRTPKVWKVTVPGQD